MKILFVISAYAPRWGGAENQARRQAVEMARHGHDVHVVTWQWDASWPHLETVDGVTVHRVRRHPGGAYADLRSLLPMTRMLLDRALPADVIAAHQMLFIAYLAGVIGMLTGTPVVVKPAITATPVDPELSSLIGGSFQARLRRIGSWALRSRAIAIAMTNEIERDLQKLRFKRIARIPNGVADPGIIDTSRVRAELYSPLGIPDGAKVVAASGRLVWYKGFGSLVSAWAALLAGLDRFLLIVGSGPEDESLRCQISALGLTESVRLIGSSSRAADYLAAADVVAIPSITEGMSNVLLEAMAAGRLVVATAVSGAVDLIAEGVNGYLVPVGDAIALARGLERGLIAPAAVGIAARQSVLARCSMDRVVGLYERLFANTKDIDCGVTDTAHLWRYPLSNPHLHGAAPIDTMSEREMESAS